MFTTFRGGQTGTWQVLSVAPVIGETLPTMPALSITHADTISLPPAPSANSWRLIGTASHVRYVERLEKIALNKVQAGLGRPEATCAALIPIRKSNAWWLMSQNERRRIFEDKSRHIADSLKYLPAIARQLYHARDLGGPFDFLTWFEYAPAHAELFEELVAMLRDSEEWQFVEREVDVRLAKVI